MESLKEIAWIIAGTWCAVEVFKEISLRWSEYSQSYWRNECEVLNKILRAYEEAELVDEPKFSKKGRK